MAGSGNAQDFAAQIVALTAKMRNNEEKFERLDAKNTAIRAANMKLLVPVETPSVDTTPPMEVPRVRFRVPVNPMQPLDEETTPIASNVHQAHATDALMTTPGMSGHLAGQQSTTIAVSRPNKLILGDNPSTTPLLI